MYSSNHIKIQNEMKAYYAKRVQELKHMCMDSIRPIEDYQFKIAKIGQAIGQCHYLNVAIYMNIDLVEKLTEEEWKDTINHEIAHALIGPGFGHGAEWRRMAVLCGATPRATTKLEYFKNEHNELNKNKKYKVFVNQNGTMVFTLFTDNKPGPGAWLTGKKRQTQGKLVTVLNLDGKPEWTEVARPEQTVQPAPAPMAKPAPEKEPTPATKPAPAKPAEKPAEKTGRKPTTKAAKLYEIHKTLPEFIAAALEVGMKESTAKIQFYAARKYFG